MEPWKRLSPDQIGAEVRDQVSRQSYAKQPVIAGVKLIDLRWLSDDSGSFTELIRCDEQGHLLALPEFKVRQSNFSEVLPGAVKAWHLHYNQEDLWFIPPSERMLVGIYDVRKDSPSYGVTMRFTMGGGKAQLLYIPRGVAHGAANPWTTRSLMIYFVNQHFSVAETDEHRLPWDILGPEFWTPQKG